MKIYDTFTFFNELDLLEIRLGILDDVVDQFVIVEATKTFQNNNKRLYFEEHKNRFRKYLNKIIHVVVDDMPDSGNTRVLEAHQRNSIVRGLRGCEPDDQIILSDVDEIPCPKKLLAYSQYPGVKAFEQALSYYYVNCACLELATLPWSIMFSYAALDRPQLMRERLIKMQAARLSGRSGGEEFVVIKNGGWHFSYLGGVDTILRKLEAFADPEYNKPKYRNKKSIEGAISNGTDLFGREYHFQFVKLDERFPGFIRKNRDRFKSFIFSAPTEQKETY